MQTTTANPLRVLDLFTGIGGIALGLQNAGMEIVGQVEIDPFCLRILPRHFPNARRFVDVRTFSAQDAASLGRIDVLAAGFPCQDISVANRDGRGLEGERSGLFYNALDILDLLRPSYLVLENVAALRRRGLGTVLGALAARGYDAEWESVEAAGIGAPHRRERVFVVAYPARGRERARVLHTAPPAVDHDAVWTHMRRERGRSPVHDELTRFAQSNPLGAANPLLVGIDDGVPAWMDHVRAFGNAVVPYLAEWIGRAIVADHAAVNPTEARTHEQHS